MQSGALDFGVVLADDAYRSYFGDSPTGQKPNSMVRAISLLQPLPTYLLARAGTGIRSVTDLEGRTVAVGPQGSSAFKLGTLVLKAFGVSPATVKALASREVAVKGLRDGTFRRNHAPRLRLPGGVHRNAAARERRVPGRIDGPPMDACGRSRPFVRVVVIPRDIYPGQDKIVPTVGIDMMIVCRRDLDERLAYRLTRQLFEVFPRLARVEATMRFLNLDDAPATPIPLHPGAARYFRERELSR
ncbi:MAG: TAXI family TRAP transporter solute-binding subunit [Vicinamibacterales bacterium]